MKEKAPGKTLLKVVGIIMVVLGVLSFLFNLINFAAIGMIGEGELGEILEHSAERESHYAECRRKKHNNICYPKVRKRLRNERNIWFRKIELHLLLR